MDGCSNIDMPKLGNLECIGDGSRSFLYAGVVKEHSLLQMSGMRNRKRVY